MLKRLIVTVGLFCCLSAVVRAEEVKLVTSAGAMPVIVVGSEATACEKYAAEELAAYLKKITGRSVQTVDEGAPITGKYMRDMERRAGLASRWNCGLGSMLC